MKDFSVRTDHRQSRQSPPFCATLESVITQAETLSATERLTLWQHLAQLPDSGIESTSDVRSLISDHWMRLKTHSTSSPASEQEWAQIGFFGLQRKGNTVIAAIDGAEVLRLVFKPKIFAENLFHTLPVKPPTEEFKQKVRSILKQSGTDRSDADIEAALDHSARQVQEVVIEAKRNHVAARFTEKLPFIVGMILDNLIRAFAFEGSNMLFEQSGKGKKFSAEEMHEMVFRHDWAQLKPMLAIRRGAPEGQRGFTQAERDIFIQQARGAAKALRDKKSSIKKIDLARKLFGRYANPPRELNRRLKKYQISFLQLTQ